MTSDPDLDQLGLDLIIFGEEDVDETERARQWHEFVRCRPSRLRVAQYRGWPHA